MLGLWCLFWLSGVCSSPSPPSPLLWVGFPGCSLSAFSFPFRAGPGCCQGRGCVCVLLFLVASPSFSCVCVWCVVVHQTPNASQTLSPLRRSLLCLLRRLVLFSPPPLASCFLPPPPCCCCCFPSLVVSGSFPVVLFAGVGWSSRHLHGHPSFNLTRSVRAGVCVCGSSAKM